MWSEEPGQVIFGANGWLAHIISIRTAKPTRVNGLTYVEALRRDQKAVLTAKQEKDGKWSRAGYIGAFKIANVAITAQGLEFDLIERLPIRLK